MVKVNWSTEIDEQLKVLLEKLNAAGYLTNSSCQGRQEPNDYKTHRHCEHAFIGFQDELTKKHIKKAEALGLYVYNGQTAVTTLSGEETSRKEIYTKNKTLVEKVAKLFNLGEINGSV